jgi:hypothetical protein
MNCPAATTTEPVERQLLFDATEEHTSVEGTIEPGAPVRNVTVIVPVCSEYTFSCVAVQPNGTQVRTSVVAVVPVSVALTLDEFTA